jgi:hypothetical protein
VEGTFKPRPGDPAEASDRIPLPGRDWQLESTLIEVLFLFFLRYDVSFMLIGIGQNRRFLARSSSFLKVLSSQYITLH